MWKKIKDLFNKKAQTVTLAAAMSTAPAVAQENNDQTEDAKQNQSEQVEISFVKQGSQAYPFLNGKLITQGRSNPKKDYKKFIKVQKKLFANAQPNKIDTLSVDRLLQDEAKAARTLGYYSLASKNITLNYYDFTSKEELKTEVAERYPEFSADPSQIDSIVNCYYAYQIVNTPEAKAVFAHEAQHKVNDQNNTYAPGLSMEQYATLNQCDEISANIAHFFIMKQDFDESRRQGVDFETAFKSLDKHFECTRNVLLNADKMSQDEFNKAVVEEISNMWLNKYQKLYEGQIFQASTVYAKNVATAAFGDEKEFLNRVEKMFDSIKDNEVLKANGIKIDKLSQFLPSQALELSPKIKEMVSQNLKKYSGMTTEEAKSLGEKMPGDSKEDARNLLKLLTGRKVSPDVAQHFNIVERTSEQQAAINKKAQNQAMMQTNISDGR